MPSSRSTRSTQESATQATTEHEQPVYGVKHLVDLRPYVDQNGKSHAGVRVKWTDGTETTNKAERHDFHKEDNKPNLVELVTRILENNIDRVFEKEIRTFLVKMEVDFELIRGEIKQQRAEASAMSGEMSQRSGRSARTPATRRSVKKSEVRNREPRSERSVHLVDPHLAMHKAKHGYGSSAANARTKVVIRPPGFSDSTEEESDDAASVKYRDYRDGVRANNSGMPMSNISVAQKGDKKDKDDGENGKKKKDGDKKDNLGNRSVRSSAKHIKDNLVGKVTKLIQKLSKKSGKDGDKKENKKDKKEDKPDKKTTKCEKKKEGGNGVETKDDKSKNYKTDTKLDGKSTKSTKRGQKKTDPKPDCKSAKSNKRGQKKTDPKPDNKSAKSVKQCGKK